MKKKKKVENSGLDWSRISDSAEISRGQYRLVKHGCAIYKVEFYAHLSCVESRKPVLGETRFLFGELFYVHTYSLEHGWFSTKYEVLLSPVDKNLRNSESIAKLLLRG